MLLTVQHRPTQSVQGLLGQWSFVCLSVSVNQGVNMKQTVSSVSNSTVHKQTVSVSNSTVSSQTERLFL